MYRELPGPMKVMDWIEEQVSVALADGRNELTWTTPSGFASPEADEKDIQVVELQLMGRCKISIASDSQEVDHSTTRMQHHRILFTTRCLPRHLSQSASTLRWSSYDSVLCRATDMACLSAIVRETYMHLFAEHDYLNDWASKSDNHHHPSLAILNLRASSNPPIFLLTWQPSTN